MDLYRSKGNMLVLQDFVLFKQEGWNVDSKATDRIQQFTPTKHTFSVKYIETEFPVLQRIWYWLPVGNLQHYPQQHK